MARFKFRLNKVLTVRLEEERKEKMRFAIRVQEKQETESRIAALNDEFEDALDRAALTASDSSLDLMVNFYNYRVGIMNRQKQARLDLKRVMIEFEDARARLVEARRQRRALELLRERHFKQWKKEEERRDQAEMDEIGMHAFVRSERFLESRKVSD